LSNCSQVSNFKSKITDLGAISISIGAETVMNETEFWNRVKGLLKKRNTTQREFTSACGIAYGTFCAGYTGTSIPRYVQCRKYF
jgi:hypothetical protein